MHDFNQDAAEFLENAESKRAQEVLNEPEELNYIPLDVVFGGEKQFKVYYDSDRRPWDVYMTKVDITNGPYGDFVFYKMQMVFDTNRELYIVLTRYGRIGETGVNQRTPFTEVEEAKKEFETIFKQKSGNEWANAET
jgi:predicted DNA-binding WGR domain protein